MLSLIRLELARCPEFPEGSAAHGYLLTLPLGAAGSLGSQPGEAIAARCPFERFWNGDETETGHLERHGRGWSLAFDGDPAGRAVREPIFKPEGHRFLPGEYISIRERDGVLRTFRIAAVTPRP